MNKIAILIDSTGDLNAELREKYGIDDYCAMHISYDGKEIPASLDWDAGVQPEELYKVLTEGRRIYTSAVTVQEYETKFTKYLDQGMDVLYISCSSGLSASINVAHQVADKLNPKYKDCKVVCIDSLVSGYAQGLMGIKARELANAGKSVDEIGEWLEKERLKFNQVASCETLRYLKAAGRVTAAAAFFGNLFGVKPILISDAKGHNFAIKKVKGRLPSIKEVAKMTVEGCEDIENSTIYIGHIVDPEGAEMLKQEILKLAKPKDIYVGMIGPIVGASTGPGTISAYFYGKEVTVVGEK